MTLPLEIVAWHPSGFRHAVSVGPNESVLIGKSANCGLRLPGPDLGDIQCQIGLEEGQPWIQSWSSSSSVNLNGELVSSRTQFAVGATVEVGSYRIQIAALQEQAETQSQPLDTTSSRTPMRPDAEQASRITLPASESKSDHSVKASCSSIEPPKPSQAPEPQQDDTVTQTPSYNTGFLDADCLLDEDDQLVDRQTVEYLQAEIEELRAALQQQETEADAGDGVDGDDDAVQERMQELIDEANRADERVLLLEEMLHAAEDANQFEAEERTQLEAWVGDIEKRVTQRDQEHAAELQNLRERLTGSDKMCEQLQSRLTQIGSGDTRKYEEALQKLQQDNSQLNDQLRTTKSKLEQISQKSEQFAQQSEVELRAERAKIAKEYAEVSRLRFELADRIKEIEERLPNATAESDPRLLALREHRHALRKMSEERKKNQEQAPFTSRLRDLWNRLQ